MSDPKPAWAQAALQSLARQREERARASTLPEHLKTEQLAGVRVFIVTRQQTGVRAPLTVLYGKDYPHYEAFLDAAAAFLKDFYATHGPEKDGLTVEEFWAPSVEDFLREHPDALRPQSAS